MEKDSLNNRTIEVLKQHDLSLVEYYVLSDVLSWPATPEQLPRFSEEISAGYRRGSFPVSEYELAMNNLFARGWLRILSADDCEELAQFYRAHLIPTQSYRARLNPKVDQGKAIPSVGQVDFTRESYQRLRAIVRQIHGEGHQQFSDSGWFVDKQGKQVVVLAETIELCQLHIDRLTNKPQLFISDTARIKEIGSIKAIGEWIPNRFTVIQSGYSAVIKYKD